MTESQADNLFILYIIITAEYKNCAVKILVYNFSRNAVNYQWNVNNFMILAVLGVE